MTTDEKIIEEMLDRATKDGDDQLSVKVFCMVICSNRHNSLLLQQALDMIVAKIRSSNQTEALRAISMLEECMSSCGIEFQDEVSKFRFLNMLITIVSIKYNGRETPLPIKQRIMDVLLLWTAEFPRRVKIREAYDSLKKENPFEQSHTTPVSPAVPKRENIFATDEEALSKLVKSTNQEDLVRANLLIQHRFKQETLRTELLLQYKDELLKARNTIALLDQMLTEYKIEAKSNIDNKIDENHTLIADLYMMCKKHKPVVVRLPELLDKEDDSYDLFKNDALETKCMFEDVMQRYKNIIVHPKTKATKQSPIRKATIEGSDEFINDFLGDVVSNSKLPTVKDLILPTAGATALSPTAGVGTNAISLKELSDIFSSSAALDCEEGSLSPLSNEKSAHPYNSLTLLKPINVFEVAAADATEDNVENVTEKNALRELKEIDELSSALFKQSLPSTERKSSFKKEPEKLSLNELLVKEKLSAKSVFAQKVEAAPIKETMDDKDITISESLMSATATTKLDCNAMVKDLAASSRAAQHVSTDTHTDSLPPFTHLSAININLDNVTPQSERLLLDDDDVRVTICFTTDRPSKHVSIIVVSLVNKSKMMLNDFQFEASVKKPSKVRLLPPSETFAAPCKPFRPQVPINQLLLLLNPTGNPVDLICIVGYKLGNDPDPIKESIVAKDIPFVE